MELSTWAALGTVKPAVSSRCLRSSQAAVLLHGEADTDRLGAAQMGSPGGVCVELLAQISYQQRKIKTTSRKQFILSFQPDRTLHTLAPLVLESEPSFSLMEEKMVPQHFSHLRNLMFAQGIQ